MIDSPMKKYLLPINEEEETFIKYSFFNSEEKCIKFINNITQVLISDIIISPEILINTMLNLINVISADSEEENETKISALTSTVNKFKPKIKVASLQKAKKILPLFIEEIINPDLNISLKNYRKICMSIITSIQNDTKHFKKIKAEILNIKNNINKDSIQEEINNFEKSLSLAYIGTDVETAKLIQEYGLNEQNIFQHNSEIYICENYDEAVKYALNKKNPAIVICEGQFNNLEWISNQYRISPNIQENFEDFVNFEVDIFVKQNLEEELLPLLENANVQSLAKSLGLGSETGAAIILNIIGNVGSDQSIKDLEKILVYKIIQMETSGHIKDELKRKIPIIKKKLETVFKVDFEHELNMFKNKQSKNNLFSRE